MESESNERKWREWLQSHSARLLLFARQQTRRAVDAEDVLQDAVVRVWRRVRAGDLSNPPPTTTVFGEIRRRAIDLGRSADRRERREESAFQNESGEKDNWFESIVETKERAQMIQLALNQISPGQSEVVTLKIWGELTFAEIAETLDIPLNTAASRYRYGLDALKKHLAPALL